MWGVCVDGMGQASVQYFNWCCNALFSSGQPFQNPFLEPQTFSAQRPLSLGLLMGAIQLLLNSSKLHARLEEPCCKLARIAVAVAMAACGVSYGIPLHRTTRGGKELCILAPLGPGFVPSLPLPVHISVVCGASVAKLSGPREKYENSSGCLLIRDLLIKRVLMKKYPHS